MLLNLRIRSFESCVTEKENKLRDNLQLVSVPDMHGVLTRNPEIILMRNKM